MQVSSQQAEALLRCNKCGFCLAHCPVYKVTGIEWTAARGRIAAIRAALFNNDLPTSELKDPLYNCLTCNACVDDCPAGVQTADIIFDARGTLWKAGSKTWLHKFVFGSLLTNNKNLLMTSRLLRFADASGLRPTARKLAVTRLLGNMGRAEAILRNVNPGNGLAGLSCTVTRLESARYRVAYFAGCYAANLDSQEAMSTVRVLNKNQVDVIIPEFTCCGLPGPAYGDSEAARKMAKRNIEVAGNHSFDAIVTACASCGSFLKNYPKLLEDEVDWKEKALSFSQKVKDINEFLVDIGITARPKSITQKITYHDPCHLSRYQKIKQQPRNLLKSVPGVDLIEMKESDTCCGAAGTYGFKNFDLSMKVLAMKMDNIENTSADIIVSSCPACVMQLSFGVRQRKIPKQVTSIIKFLDRVY